MKCMRGGCDVPRGGNATLCRGCADEWIAAGCCLPALDWSLSNPKAPAETVESLRGQLEANAASARAREAMAKPALPKDIEALMWRPLMRMFIDVGRESWQLMNEIARDAVLFAHNDAIRAAVAITEARCKAEADKDDGKRWTILVDGDLRSASFPGEYTTSQKGVLLEMNAPSPYHRYTARPVEPAKPKRWRVVHCGGTKDSVTHATPGEAEAAKVAGCGPSCKVVEVDDE